jgi:hypothetical protein
MINKTRKPQLQWLETKEIEPGFLNPILDQILYIPGQTGYIGRGLQIVRGNILWGRPKALDLLNICYLDEFRTEELPVNDTLHGEPSAVCADGWGDKFWRGPIVAHLKVGNDMDAKKMMDMTLTAYRDAIDYLAYYRDTVGSMIDWPGSKAVLSKRVMEQRSGTVKGVRINCVGNVAGDLSRQYVTVNVPRAHPALMIGDDLLDIPDNFEEGWVCHRYNGFEDTSSPDAQNPMGKMLMRAISAHYLDEEDYSGKADWGGIPDWRQQNTTGSLPIVSRNRTDLLVSKVKAVCEFVKEEVIPLLADEEMERERILEMMAPEFLEEFA